jgi:hypothetical protein
MFQICHLYFTMSCVLALTFWIAQQLQYFHEDVCEDLTHTPTVAYEGFLVYVCIAVC